MTPWRQKKPLEWQTYINNEVKAVADQKRQYRGWLFTVDPVSASIVLVSFQENGKAHVTVVMGHAVEEVEILQEGDGEMVNRLTSLFMPSGDQVASREELQRRKARLRVWLEKNRIPVSEEGEMLRVAGVLSINPPYGSADCISSNEIILSRVQGLVKSNPDLQN